jgi:hypothetical protein
MMKKRNQNWRNIYVLSFKTMTFITSCSFFIHMNVKEFFKNPFDKFFNLSFILGPLKVNTYCVKRNQFCKELSQGII